MNRIAILICCLMLGLSLQGQTSEKLFIGSGGGYFQNSDYQSLVSIGEPVTGFIKGAAELAEQGFAPVEDNGGSSSSSLNTASNRVDISLYPNPFGNNLFIKVPSGTDIRKVEIYNILGVKVAG